jgi:DNA-binding NarL/FixJ family response regulator
LNAVEPLEIAHRSPANGASANSPGAGVVTVVIVDPNEVASRALRFGLQRHGLAVLGIAHDENEALALLGEHNPAICLVDREILARGIALEELREAAPRARIAVLGSNLKNHTVLAAVLSGADGYMPKSTAPDRLAAALVAMMRGEPALPRAFTRVLVAELRDAPRRPRRLSWTVKYPVRFVRHYRHRRRTPMSASEALASTRRRMQHYRER